MGQRQYLIDKIIRNGKIESMSKFIERIELEPTDITYIDEKVKPLGYTVNMEEILQLQVWNQAKKITNCKDRCSDDYWPMTTPSRRENPPSPKESPKEQVKYFIPLKSQSVIGA